MCTWEIATVSTRPISGVGTRRRRCAIRGVSAGSVSRRKPSTSTSTVACPTQVTVIGGRLVSTAEILAEPAEPGMSRRCRPVSRRTAPA